MITLNTQQRLKEDFSILSRHFTFFSNSSFSFLLSLFNFSCTKFLLCNVLQSVGNMYWGTFLGRLFLLLFPTNCICCSYESVNAYNFIKRVPEKQAFNTVTPNANPNQIKIDATNTAMFLDQKILFYRNINNKNTCKIVCKMECLKNRL